jgi:hypothetical protein
MSFTNGENPGAPYGARWDDDYHTGPAPRAERYAVANPWSAAGCEECRDAQRRDSPRGGCTECVPLKPITVVPGGPGPDDELPCFAVSPSVFETEEVTDEHRDLCGSCPFQDWCLSTAIANDEHFIWAATNRQDRKALAGRGEGKAA